jgi:hypothetical protein
LKFTKNEGEQYQLTGGVYYHNHELTAAVLDPDILAELDSFDAVKSKPAVIKRFVQTKFGKEISYA